MFRVLEAGFQTSVQDRGRFGLGDRGISPAGPMDALALRLGNLIVGNPPDAAGLEITLVGPTFAVEADVAIALAGATFAARWRRSRGGWPAGEVALPLWQAVHLRRGDVVALGAARAGARAYLCVAGGIDVPLVLGSRATHLLAQLGGLDGRALQVGDRLRTGEPRMPADRLVGRRLRPSLWPTYPPELHVRVVMGPQTDRFTEAAQAAFLRQPYRVAPDSNRMAVRLTGAPLSHTAGADLLSEGVALGAVQVPQNGQPIILLAERQTTGGYTKIATVIGADVDRIGQARPGTTIRFEAVTVEAALALRRAREALVDEASIARTAAWGSQDIVAVMESFAASGLAELKLATEGVRLVLRREQTGRLPRERGSSAEKGGGAETASPVSTREPAFIEVTAPLLGVFYTAPAPEQPPFVEPGGRVEQNQVVAQIDVMKTLHQVRAPTAGQLLEVLVEDGTLVEYGQPLMRLAPERADGA